MHFGSPLEPLQPWGLGGTHASPRGSTSKFIKFKKLANKSSDDKNSLHRWIDQLFGVREAAERSQSNVQGLPHDAGQGKVEIRIIYFETTLQCLITSPMLILNIYVRARLGCTRAADTS